MSEYKLIAFDMDGTLLDSSKQIRQDSLDAIHDAVAAGKYVALATGRSLVELKDYLDILKDVSYIISASGAYIFTNPGMKVIYSKDIEEELVLKVLERSSKFDLMWHMHGTISVVQKNQYDRLEAYSMSVYRNLFDRLAIKVPDLAKYYKDKKFPVNKFNIYCKTTRDRDLLTAALKDLPVSRVFAETTSLEISPKGISKAFGLRTLCNYLNIPVSQSIAVGDGDNDIEILEEAGLGVAMDNATDKALNAADVAVASNNDGGCAQAIRQYLLREE